MYNFRLFPLFFIFSLIAISPASARYNPNWKWNTVRSEYFTIYFPAGHEAFAQRVLSVSDEVHHDISCYLGVKPRRCPVVLNPGTDVFNGFYSLLPNRISLFETPMATQRGFGAASDIIDLVYTHEYTHYVHVTTRLGWYGALSRVLGDGFAITNAISPLWFIEGITTNTETMFTDGGRGRSPLFRGRMMAFTEGKGLWGLSGAGTLPVYEPPGDRVYLSGYFLVEYMNRVYGNDAFPRLGKYQARHPMRPGKAILHVTGKSPKMFYREFLKDFEARVQELKSSVQTDRLPSGQVVYSRPLDGFVALFWTEKGTIQAIRLSYTKKTSIVEIDPDNGAILREEGTGFLNVVSRAIRRTTDGRLVMGEIFLHPLGEGELDTTDLVVFDIATKKRSRLTCGAHIFSADLSPDGSTFVATRRNGMWIDVVLLDADGKNIRTIISKPGLCFEGTNWSNDGLLITAVVKSGRNSDIVTINPRTGTLKTLFKTDAHEDNDPVFSPDGRWILFSSSRSGVWNIYAWDIREENLYQVTSVPYGATEPKVSPDGGEIAFFSISRGLNQVCILPFEPQAWKKVSVEDGDTIEEPNLSRLEPPVSFAGRPVPFWEAYRPFIHTPYFDSDEDGSQAGMFVMGSDPIGIHSYSAALLYGFESGRAGYDIQYTNKSFWPVIQVRVYDSADEGNTLSGGKNHWVREQGKDISLGMNVIHSITPSIITSSYKIGARVRKFYGLKDVLVFKDRDQSLGFYGELTVSHKPDSAPRDMIPGWGQSLFLSHEEGFSVLTTELPGHNTFISVKQYIPSVLRHHGFELTGVHQNQNGYLRYDNDFSIPRGYSVDDGEGGLNLRRNLLLSLEYHFPIVYPDRGLGLMLYHMNLLKGSVFVDYGAGWDDHINAASWEQRARTSIGGTLTTKSYFLSFVPVEFGFAAGYKVREDEGFTEFILRFDY